MSDRFEIRARGAIERLLEEKSLDEITAADITNDLGLSKQAFYYHAKNVPDYLCRRIEQEIKAETDDCGGNIDRLITAMKYGMLYYRERSLITESMMNSSDRNRYLDCLYFSIHKETLKVLNRYYENLTSVPPEEMIRDAAEYVADSIHGVIRRDIETGMKKGIGQQIECYKRFYGKSISVKIENFMKTK